MKTITEFTKSSNSLIFKTNKIVGKEHIFVTIRLNDECRNGHQDFAITADIYVTGKPKIDKYYIGGACMHEEILKAYPEFKIFVNLHLCDYTGAPMHPIANGMYFLRNGFNNTKPEDKNFPADYCDYYRMSLDQFNVLNTSRNDIDFALKLRDLGILQQWQIEANKAIEMLEDMTGTKFIVDSKKTQLIFPTDEQIKAEQDKIDKGYYSQKAIEERNQEKKNKFLDDLAKDRDKTIKKANDEYNVKVAVFNAGLPLNNFIYYTHSNEGCFNWNTSSYNKEVTKDQFDEFIKNVDKSALPENITFKLKG